MNQTVIWIDPKDLILPSSMQSGADPWKLQKQLAKYGSSLAGMPPILVMQDLNGSYEIIDGVTRATRIAKYAPDALVPICVIGHYKASRSHLLKVSERI